MYKMADIPCPVMLTSIGALHDSICDDEDSNVSDYDEVSIDETAPSGHCWSQICVQSNEGRPPARNIFRARPGVRPGI